MTAIPRYDGEGYLRRLRETEQPFHHGYLAMYSSIVGGIVTDPVLMTVPVDDHGFHRGDAVFETLKAVGGAVYNLEAHLDRLYGSAESIGLSPGPARDEVTGILLETLSVAGRPDAHVRVLITRGPGSLSVDPYDCPAPGLYIVVQAAKTSFMDRCPGGASAGASTVAAKPGWQARIKSCNYLQNVMMKKEAVDRGLDFVFAFDENRNLAESATENVGIIDDARRLRVPAAESVLAGTTMLRILELARTLVADGALTEVLRGAIPESDVLAASEILIFGTTTDVTSVTRYGGEPVGAGTPGPVGAALQRLLLDDIRANPDMRTVFSVASNASGDVQSSR